MRSFPFSKILRTIGAALASAFAAVAVVPWSSGYAQELEESGVPWTENVNSKDGLFALAIDGARILVIRSDNRNLGNLELRVRVQGSDGRVKELLLHRSSQSSDSPLRYGAALGESVVSLELESSSDGKKWKSLGKFRRP